MGENTIVIHPFALATIKYKISKHTFLIVGSSRWAKLVIFDYSINIIYVLRAWADISYFLRYSAFFTGYEICEKCMI